MEPVHFITQSVFSFGNDLLYCYWVEKKKKKEETGLFSLKGNPGLATRQRCVLTPPWAAKAV